MKGEFSIFEECAVRGMKPEELVFEARRQALDTISIVRMLRMVVGCDLIEAKRIVVRADHNGMSLEEHQGKWLAVLQELLT